MNEIRSVGSHLSERVRRYREALGLRQEDVADRTAQLGYPLGRVTLAKIEKGGTRADNASLVDVLVLAAALDVPPPMLFLPIGEAEQVAVTSKFVTHPQIVLEWIAGEDDLRDVVPWPGHVEAWARGSQTLRLFNGLREHETEVHRAAATLAGVERLGPPNETTLAATRSRFDRSLAALHAWRKAMQQSGLVLPDLPGEWEDRIAQLVEEDGRGEHR